MLGFELNGGIVILSRIDNEKGTIDRVQLSDRVGHCPSDKSPSDKYKCARHRVQS
jgi:hypothetical protein